jgi:hypothetical protein
VCFTRLSKFYTSEVVVIELLGMKGRRDKDGKTEDGPTRFNKVESVCIFNTRAPHTKGEDGSGVDGKTNQEGSNRHSAAMYYCILSRMVPKGCDETSPSPRP